MIHDSIHPSRRGFLRTSLIAAGGVLPPSLHTINAVGSGEGASGFLMAMAMPPLAIECVLEGKPWPGCF